MLNADHCGDSALQGGPQGATGSEDCLTPNAVRPENTNFPNAREIIRGMFGRNGHADGYEAIKDPARVFDRESCTENPDRTDIMTAWGDMRYYE